jgi:hypothetical protein
MRFAYLSFEAILTIFWFWGAFWTFGIFLHGDGDYGTIVGGLLLFAFGAGTLAMLINEAHLMLRQRASAQKKLHLPLLFARAGKSQAKE